MQNIIFTVLKRVNRNNKHFRPFGIFILQKRGLLQDLEKVLSCLYFFFTKIEFIHPDEYMIELLAFAYKDNFEIFLNFYSLRHLV